MLKINKDRERWSKLVSFSLATSQPSSKLLPPTNVDQSSTSFFPSKCSFFPMNFSFDVLSEWFVRSICTFCVNYILFFFFFGLDSFVGCKLCLIKCWMNFVILYDKFYWLVFLLLVSWYNLVFDYVLFFFYRSKNYIRIPTLCIYFSFKLLYLYASCIHSFN